MPKAILLARVSTKEQEEYGHSLPAQLERLRAYADRKGFEVVREFAFSESAGTKIRKKFEEVIDYLKRQKPMPVLLCQNVDRSHNRIMDIRFGAFEALFKNPNAQSRDAFVQLTENVKVLWYITALARIETVIPGHSL